ncbi:hypothetical protein BI308_17115 [Roseofilum reptotaenium AO1-A]|uniref:Uncharacterized protein n=1 Tax=Roseofilum reptotaenium AO1-A TaxID=1925591 RepID=A0A1L9QNN9_9CYAN|nr:hypothetical protein BI308_17115 [Roseofilum reptotaenium AO1-A]
MERKRGDREKNEVKPVVQTSCSLFASSAQDAPIPQPHPMFNGDQILIDRAMLRRISLWAISSIYVPNASDLLLRLTKILRTNRRVS